MIETFTDHGYEYFFANSKEEDAELRAIAKRLRVPEKSEDDLPDGDVLFPTHGNHADHSYKEFAALVVREGNPILDSVRAKAKVIP